MDKTRIAIDTTVGLALVAGLIAWGSSQAVQGRLVKDVADLQTKMQLAIEDNKQRSVRNQIDLEYIKKAQERQLQLLEKIERKVSK